MIKLEKTALCFFLSCLSAQYLIVVGSKLNTSVKVGAIFANYDEFYSSLTILTFRPLICEVFVVNS